MTYPVYIGDRAAGTMTVTAAGQDTVFELRCPDPEPGLWRAWVQGEEGRLDLGLLEGGRLRRRFSRRLKRSFIPAENSETHKKNNEQKKQRQSAFCRDRQIHKRIDLLKNFYYI